jgi:3D (Asp-Asp-Asp) domain-containing protein
MIRFIFSALFLIGGMGLPLLAKGTAMPKPAVPVSSKAGSKTVLAPKAPAPAVAAKEKAPAPEKPLLTSDRSRANIAALAAAKPQPASPAPTKTAKEPVVAQHSSSSATVAAVKKTAVSAHSDLTSSATKKNPTTSGSATISSLKGEAESVMSGACKRLARVTAYWAGEGDYYTGRCLSATGVRLHDGHCAVDPNIIPYGSVVEIAGVGKFLAVDTGSAVISRTAARESGHTSAERGAIVVDVFFEDAREGERFAAGVAKFVSISWWAPTATSSNAQAARGLFADENWVKIQSKQL